MHQYLRSIGFSNIKTKKQLRELLNDVISGKNKKEYIDSNEEGTISVEFTKNYSTSCAMTLRGEFDEENNLTLDFYYPIASVNRISTTEELTFERHSDKDSYAAVCDDIRVGVSLIFYVQNGMFLQKSMKDDDFPKTGINTCLGALSLGGTIMLPIKKTAKEQERFQKASADRNKRIIAAKNGDEEAIEQLTLEDMDTYNVISKRVLKEDVFTLVDTYFMPFGVECDHYSILGEIEDYRVEINKLSGESVYVLDLSCNELPITVCINKDDLLGQPEIGRRFKGNIWLQGQIGI